MMMMRGEGSKDLYIFIAAAAVAPLSNSYSPAVEHFVPDAYMDGYGRENNDLSPLFFFFQFPGLAARALRTV